jgi:phenylacetate-coenzyme A ligase PaaK-like adenylate-forming protein
VTLSTPTLTWITRSELQSGSGLLLVSPLGDTTVGLELADLDGALELAAAGFTAAGITASDRVVVALNSDGGLTGALFAQAAARVAAAAAAPGPRGRMRLLSVLRAIDASVLVTTPTGALDLLARLHLEFLVDPLDLGLHRIVLTGEIGSPGTARHLAAEFGAEITELYSDPVFGLPAAVVGEGLEPLQDGLLALALLDADTLLAPPYAAGRAELVLRPLWHGGLGGHAIRTGHVVVTTDGPVIPPPAHTVGDHVLVRGRWLSLPKLTQALARIDGIAHWNLVLARSGTLDQATLHVTFARESLLQNPMWTRRIEQAVTAVTPVTIAVTIAAEASEATRTPQVTDQRGQHLAPGRG